MKWENRNVNVEEYANSPQFDKQDDAGAPLRLSESLFVDALVDMMCWQHQVVESLRESRHSLKISIETFRLFSGMLFLRGCHMLPDRKIYWETCPELLSKQCLIQCHVSKYSSKSPSLLQQTTL